MDTVVKVIAFVIAVFASTLTAAFAAAALNYANGYGEAPKAPPIMWTAPLRCVDGLDIMHQAGVSVLRVRGWGRLQKLGHEEGAEAQRIIGNAFADAMNAACQPNP